MVLVALVDLGSSVLFQNKNSDFCAPLTSFDWNEVDPNLIGTSSIDTTCTIWGLETGQVSLTCFFDIYKNLPACFTIHSLVKDPLCMICLLVCKCVLVSVKYSVQKRPVSKHCA